jgi:RNA polymerase sigma factor (sigma-70 family)
MRGAHRPNGSALGWIGPDEVSGIELGAAMTSADPIVYVVDDDLYVRGALGSLIRSVGLRAATFASTHDFLQYTRPDAPSCLVLDVLLPDATGLELADRLRTADVQIPIIFITGHGTIPMSVRAMKGGAVEFLTKPICDEAFISALQQALERDERALEQRAELAQLRGRLETLTAREREVFALVATGRSNKQIAEELGAAEQTIKQHRGRVTRKLGVRSVAELVRLAERVNGQPWGPPIARK